MFCNAIVFAYEEQTEQDVRVRGDFYENITAWTILNKVNIFKFPKAGKFLSFEMNCIVYVNGV